MRDGTVLRADVWRAEGDRAPAGHPDADSVRQADLPRLLAAARGGRARLRVRGAGRARPLRVGRRVRRVSPGAPGRLRRRGVGRGPALVERPRRHGRPVLPRRGAVAVGRRGAAAPGLHLPGDVLLVGPPVHLLRRRVRPVVDSLERQQHRARRTAPPRPDRPAHHARGARGVGPRRPRRVPPRAAQHAAAPPGRGAVLLRVAGPPGRRGVLAVHVDRVGPRPGDGARVQPERVARRGLRADWRHAQLQRPARARGDRSEPHADAAAHRPVDARRSLAAEDARRRPRLRRGGRPRLQRARARLVRLARKGRREPGREDAAGPPLRDGRQPVARRAVLAHSRPDRGAPCIFARAAA